MKMKKETTEQGQGQSQKPQRERAKKMTNYGTQLFEKQKVKEMYGMREKQFRRFFDIATKEVGGAGENLLSLLERRLDNVVYRLKLAVTRTQSRQIIVHGHIFVNGKKVYSPSYLINANDEVSLDPKALTKTNFMAQVVDKRLGMGIKVPEWIELNKNEHKGKILRLPVRSDIQTPIEEHLIVELYSK